MATFTATATRLGDTLTHEVDVNGRHHMLTDEPEAIGGFDLAPAPHELLAAALASCVSTTVAIYARRHGWAIGEVSVDVDYDSDTVPRQFDVTVHLPAGLSDDQRTRLTRVAQSCPVARAFETGFTVEEHIGEPAPSAC
jgi:putative redox protein